MKIRKCGEIRKSFVIETLVKKIDFINSELDNKLLEYAAERLQEIIKEIK